MPTQTKHFKTIFIFLLCLHIFFYCYTPWLLFKFLSFVSFFCHNIFQPTYYNIFIFRTSTPRSLQTFFPSVSRNKRKYKIITIIIIIEEQKVVLSQRFLRDKIFQVEFIPNAIEMKIYVFLWCYFIFYYCCLI